MASSRQFRSTLQLARICVIASLLTSTQFVRAQEPVQPAPESLHARVLLTADRFIPFEPIPYEFWLENLAASSVEWTPPPFRFWWTSLEAVDHPELNQQLVMRNVPTSGTFAPNYQPTVYKLEPGQSTEHRIANLLETNGIGLGVIYLYLPPGKYRLFNPDLPSDTVIFSVVEPSHPDDQRAVAALFSLRKDMNLIASAAASDSVFREIQLSSGGSRLLPYVLAQRLSLKVVGERFSDPERLHQLAFELITRYPADYYATNGLYDIDVNQLSPADRERLAAALSRMAAENRHAIIYQRIPMIEELRARASNSTDR